MEVVDCLLFYIAWLTRYELMCLYILCVHIRMHACTDRFSTLK